MGIKILLYVKNDFRNFHQIFKFWALLSQKIRFLWMCPSVCLSDWNSGSFFPFFFVEELGNAFTQWVWDSSGKSDVVIPYVLCLALQRQHCDFFEQVLDESFFAAPPAVSAFIKLPSLRHHVAKAKAVVAPVRLPYGLINILDLHAGLDIQHLNSTRRSLERVSLIPWTVFPVI